MDAHKETMVMDHQAGPVDTHNGASVADNKHAGDRTSDSPVYIKPEHINESDSTSLESGRSFDSKATTRLLRKMDWHLVPFLALLYLLSFLDRTNIGNARLDTLEVDLNMKDLDYNVALAVFFPFYVAAEIPSNMAMKRFRPSVWLTIIMIAWAIVMICMGFVQNFGGLIATRIFLGIAEGGLFPGVTYYITMWYRRHECGFRMALFFSAATAAGAFGGLLARGIMEMGPDPETGRKAVGGYAGWRWIFILEGLLTLAVAAVAYWAINDYPRTAKFLNNEERIEVERRLKHDRNGLSDEFDMKFLWDALKDWKIYVHMLITIGIYTPLYSVSLFLPTIVKVMGHSNETAQLMTVPPYVVACLFTIAAGYGADKMKQRGLFMAFFEIVAIIGFAMLLGSGKPAIQYAGTFFAASGIYPLVPMGVAWNGNNIGGSLKRGVGIAMHVGFGNLGGAISAFIYLKKDSPRFKPGHAALASTVSMSFCLTMFMHFYLKRENSRRDRLAAERNLQPEDYTEEQKYAERDLGDNASFYRYTV